MKAWYKLVVLKTPFQTSCTRENSMTKDQKLPSNFPEFTYVELFEYSIPGNSFGITSNEDVRSDINNSLRILSSKVIAEYGMARGRKKQQLDTRSKRFHLYHGQIISVTELKQENALIWHELEKWKELNTNLELDIKEHYKEIEIAMQQKDEEIVDLQAKNEELLRYIDILERSENMQHKGKDISETKKKSKTLKSFLPRAQTALWFAKSFGLSIESLSVKESNSGIEHNLFMDDDAGNTRNVSVFDAVSNDDKLKIEKVLFLLDKFCHR